MFFVPSSKRNNERKKKFVAAATIVKTPIGKKIMLGISVVSLLVLSILALQEATGPQPAYSTPLSRQFHPSSIPYAARAEKGHVPAALPKQRNFKRAGRPWSDEEEIRLLELREQDLPWSEIMESFPDRTWSAVRGKYRKLTRDPSTPKVKQARGWSPEEDERLLELKENTSKSWKEIAKLMTGPPQRTEATCRRRYRLLTSRLSDAPPAIRRSRLTADEDAFIVQSYNEGMSLEDIARALNRGRSSVHRHVKTLLETGRLDPSVRIDRSPFTPAELELMREERAEGKTWVEIRRESFPERTANALVKRYSKYLKEIEEQRNR